MHLPVQPVLCFRMGGEDGATKTGNSTALYLPDQSLGVGLAQVFNGMKIRPLFKAIGFDYYTGA
jgi:hypothetical protein